MLVHCACRPRSASAGIRADLPGEQALAFRQHRRWRIVDEVAAAAIDEQILFLDADVKDGPCGNQ